MQADMMMMGTPFSSADHLQFMRGGTTRDAGVCAGDEPLSPAKGRRLSGGLGLSPRVAASIVTASPARAAAASPGGTSHAGGGDGSHGGDSGDGAGGGVDAGVGPARLEGEALAAVLGSEGLARFVGSKGRVLERALGASSLFDPTLDFFHPLPGKKRLVVVL